MELLVNGKSLGRKKNDISDIQKRNRIFWDNVPYEPGNIEAVAYKVGNSEPVSRHRIETSGNAVRLKAVYDNHTWKADGKDLQYLSISAVDKDGRLDCLANASVTFEVDGPAEIIGVINGDMNSEELTVGNQRRLYDGTLSVILRAGVTPGAITFRAVAAGKKIRPITLNLTTK